MSVKVHFQLYQSFIGILPKVNDGMELNEKFLKYFFYSELAGLYIIAFSMPFMESMKWSGFTLLLLGTAGRVAFQGRSEWCKPNTFEWFLILSFGVTSLSAAVNWPLPSGISGLKDIFSYLLVGWLMSINRYSAEQIKIFLFALIGGVLLGLILSAFDFFGGKNPFLEFKSIPNLNRSVIYLLITIFTMYGILLDNKGNFSAPTKIWVGACLAVALVSLVIMGSRAGIITFVTGMLLLFLSFFSHRRIRIFLIVGFFALVIVSAGLTKYIDIPAVKSRLDKFEYYYQMIKGETSDLSIVNVSNRVRFDYLRMAWAQITQKNNLLLGSGPSTFGYIKVEELDFTPPLLEYKKTWEKPSHAHNEYMNRWVEQGLVGLGLHIAFLLYIGVCLFRHRSKVGRICWLWVACLGIFNITVVAGLFNTVFANEIAWQVMMLLGLFMQKVNLDNRVRR